MFAMDDDRKTGGRTNGNDRNSPDRMSVPYICLTAVVAVLAGVVLAWIG